jgi:hypothetical protein
MRWMWFLLVLVVVAVLAFVVQRAVARRDAEVDSYYEREHRDPPAIGFPGGGGMGGGAG